jgi:hypothetical protein
MSLEACPVCGYAVSSDTLHCRHCPADVHAKIAPAVWLNVLGFAVAVAGAIYLLFFR